jgi:precorrin-6B methylase 2
MLSSLDLKAGQTIVDLGAAYGRMGLVLAAFNEGVSFMGYEVSPERVQEGNRINDQLGANQIQLLQEDISHTSWTLPDADVFFIYDFGDLESIVRVIDQLKKMASKKPIRVVGRGRRTRDQIERHEPWLSQVNLPLHCGNFSIYRS